MCVYVNKVLYYHRLNVTVVVQWQIAHISRHLSLFVVSPRGGANTRSAGGCSE